MLLSRHTKRRDFIAGFAGASPTTNCIAYQNSPPICSVVIIGDEMSIQCGGPLEAKMPPWRPLAPPPSRPRGRSVRNFPHHVRCFCSPFCRRVRNFPHGHYGGSLVDPITRGGLAVADLRLRGLDQRRDPPYRGHARRGPARRPCCRSRSAARSITSRTSTTVEQRLDPPPRPPRLSVLFKTIGGAFQFRKGSSPIWELPDVGGVSLVLLCFLR